MSLRSPPCRWIFLHLHDTRRDAFESIADKYNGHIKYHESRDFEGIYKDITRNTVYVVEWSRTIVALTDFVVADYFRSASVHSAYY